MAGCVDQIELVLAAAGTGVASRTACALMVMPRSRSKSMVSSTCSRMSRGLIAPVRSNRRSARVDLPWSMWAMMQKLRMRATSLTLRTVDGGLTTPRRC